VKAKLISNQTPVGERSHLADELPLATPYMLQVFPVYACNFKCNYCIFSVPRHDRGYVSSQKMLDVSLYRKCIDDLSAFPDRLRMLRFAGTGEPLLHPDIAAMISYAAQAKVAQSIDIVTNASLLGRRLAEDLVSAGTSRIRISLQGVSRERYGEISGTFEDLDAIVDNVTYLYGIRGQTEVYVKIIDSALDAPADEEKFLALFGDIADVLSIEHLLPATPLIDYTRVAGKATMALTQNGAEVTDSDICPQPFYMLQLNPDGMLVPCCAMESPLTIGNIADSSIAGLWNGEDLKRFRRQHLGGRRSENAVCKGCQQFRYAMFPEDVLDGAADRLARVFT